MNALSTIPGSLGVKGVIARRQWEAAQILEQCELLRTILQSQSATLLLLRSGSPRNHDELEFALVRCAGWIAELTEQLHRVARHNLLAEELCALAPKLEQLQSELLGLLAHNRTGTPADLRQSYQGLLRLHTEAEFLLHETAAELASINSGCACEIETLTKKTRGANV